VLNLRHGIAALDLIQSMIIPPGAEPLESALSDPYLVIKDCSEGRPFPLTASKLWKMGRSEQCSIVIHDTTISRTHAMIQCTDSDEYYLIDMGSRNGTFVNERRVSTPVLLRNGDLISLGQTAVLFWNPNQIARGATPLPTARIDATKVLFTRSLISALVVDIRSYTVLSQSIDQGVLCQLIGTWFNEADTILRKYGCSGQKYIGDAVMAMWLHRTQGQEGTEILRILHALADFAKITASLSQRFSLPNEVRIGAGLNTGTAAVGNPGTAQVMDFTALGDTVNAAFRLETASKDLKTDVVLGQNTFDYIKAAPVSAAHFHGAEVQLKGYSAPQKTWSTSFSGLDAFLHAVENPGAG
jgi:adenylate cyclase